MNILYLTSEYKDFSLGKKDNFTYISNSFCRKWVKAGHNVIVIHNASCFPLFVYFLPSIIKKSFEFKRGFTWGDYDSIKYKDYYDDNVHVYRFPIKKIIPHVSPFNFILNKQVLKIKQVLNKNNFVPDVMVGQWISPQMELIYKLKKIYNCKTAVVLHGDGYINQKKFPIDKYINSIDKVGVRSKYQVNKIKNILNLNYNPFVCYSGLPDEYMDDFKFNLKKFDNIKVWKFAFVGRLVEYKKADIVIKALSKLVNVEWELNIVGEGAQMTELKDLCKKLNCEKRVIFYGKVDRKKVMEILYNCHCFIMVSIAEVFGLVYLEAMGSCCITVASKNGGIDGVINNGENGYLIEEGNEKELEKLLIKIIKLKNSDINKLVENGYNTAHEFSESKVAIEYLNCITGSNII